MKNGNLQSGLNSTNHSKEGDLLTPLNSSYSFSETSATLTGVTAAENTTVGDDLNFRFHMLLKSTVSVIPDLLQSFNRV